MQHCNIRNIIHYTPYNIIGKYSVSLMTEVLPKLEIPNNAIFYILR